MFLDKRKKTHTDKEKRVSALAVINIAIFSSYSLCTRKRFIFFCLVLGGSVANCVKPPQLGTRVTNARVAERGDPGFKLHPCPSLSA